MEPPQTNYILTLIKPFSLVWYVIPLLKTGVLASTRNLFLRFWQWKTSEKTGIAMSLLWYWPQPLPTGGIQWLLVKPWTSSIGRCARVTYRHIAMAIKTASFVGVFVDGCLFACCPGSRWGNMEQAVARWQHPVVSGVALDMPHWTMPSVLNRRIAMAIETAGGWGAFVHHQQFCHRHKT